LVAVASPVNIHHLRPRAGLVGLASVYLQHSTSVYWHFKNLAWVWSKYSRSDNHCCT